MFKHEFNGRINMRTTDSETTNQPINAAWLTAIAIFMIVLGMLAIVFPFIASIASTVLFGWVFIVAGVAQVGYAIQSKHAGQTVWKAILGILYVVAGFYVLVNPLQGTLTLTLVLGITIFVQGIIQVALAFQMRRVSPNWGWMLVSGIAGIILGIFIWSDFPFNAVWLLGTWVGINLLFDGVWMLTLRSEQYRASS
jgi:uncharacterized membrane protein HdeD (DUF308 family)